MSRQGSLLRGALALVILASSRVHADDAPPRVQTDDAPPPVTLDEVVVRLPRAQADADPTAAASVVEPERYAGEAKQVAELVSTAPGVAVSGYGGLGQLSTVSIRGSTADGVLVLVDGLPINGAFGGGVDLSTIPSRWIERIEVVRGAEGAHYGAGALGGVLNVITRRPEAGRWAAETSAGSFGSYGLAADGAFGDARSSVLAAASLDTTDGGFPWTYDPSPYTGGDERTLTRRNNGATRGAALVKVASALGGARLDGLLQLSGGHREVPLPPASGDLAGSSWEDDGRLLAMLRLGGIAPRPGLSLSARVHGRLDRLDVRIDERSNQRGGAAGLAGEASLVHGPGLLTGTAEVAGETVDASGAGTHGRATFAATLAEDLALAGGRVRLSPAARAEAVGPFGGWSAKLGGSVRLAPGLTARASAGRTFRAPGFAELYLQQGMVKPNPDLAPERGLGADVALVAEGRHGFASAGAYATRYDDLILYDQVSLDYLKPRNMGRALMSGVELEAASAPLRPLANLSLSGSYTLLASRNQRGAEEELGRWVPHRARHRLFARAAVAPGRVSASVEAQYVGRQYLDTRNVLEVPAALVWNVAAGIRLARRSGLALGLAVKNALDDRTIEDAIGNPLPGRTVMVTLRAGASPTEGTP